MDHLRMVPLLTTRSGFEAQVLAARLGADGIVWQLRGGAADSVYPIGSVDVLVAEDDLDRARELLGDDLAEHSDTGGRAAEWWVAVAVLVTLCLFIALRVFSL